MILTIALAHPNFGEVPPSTGYVVMPLGCWREAFWKLPPRKWCFNVLHHGCPRGQHCWLSYWHVSIWPTSLNSPAIRPCCYILGYTGPLRFFGKWQVLESLAQISLVEEGLKCQSQIPKQITHLSWRALAFETIFLIIIFLRCLMFVQFLFFMYQ